MSPAPLSVSVGHWPSGHHCEQGGGGEGGGCENGEQICVIKCHVSKQTYCNTKGEIGKAVGCRGYWKETKCVKRYKGARGGREGGRGRETEIEKLLLFIGCLMSGQHANVSRGRICSDKFMCCHTEIEVVDQTFYPTWSQYIDTGPTSLSAYPITPGPGRVAIEVSIFKSLV